MITETQLMIFGIGFGSCLGLIGICKLCRCLCCSS